jgi:hypothetical protein
MCVLLERHPSKCSQAASRDELEDAARPGSTGSEWVNSGTLTHERPAAAILDADGHSAVSCSSLHRAERIHTAILAVNTVPAPQVILPFCRPRCQLRGLRSAPCAVVFGNAYPATNAHAYVSWLFEAPAAVESEQSSVSLNVVRLTQPAEPWYLVLPVRQLACQGCHDIR